MTVSAKVTIPTWSRSIRVEVGGLVTYVGAGDLQIAVKWITGQVRS